MDVQLVSAANNKFALDLFKILYDGNQNQNTFVSPFSISVALAMTHLGAREETAQGMAKALRWETNDETKLHEQFQAYVTQLQTPNDQYQLSTANRIYIEKSYAVLDEFKNKTKKCYLAETVISNFVSDADNERLQINSWVSEQTKNKINDLLAAGVLDALTRMVLINAIYFKGNWDKQFEVENTKPKPFKVAPGQTKDVPMMTMTHNFPYIVDEELKCTALEIPYKGRELGMVIILPDEDFGLQTLVNCLTSEKLEDLLSQVRGPGEEVNFSFPKFEMTSTFCLKSVLSKLGMGAAFSKQAANCSGVASDWAGLYLDQVVHKAFIKVTEEGTEAAAATALVSSRMRRQASPNLQIIVDHPFFVSYT